MTVARELPGQPAKSWIVLAILLVLATPPVMAEDEWAEEGRNSLGIYPGVTSSGDDEGLSVGIDYERRLTLRLPSTSPNLKTRS
jgi:hypothetical protein